MSSGISRQTRVIEGLGRLACKQVIFVATSLQTTYHVRDGQAVAFADFELRTVFLGHVGVLCLRMRSASLCLGCERERNGGELLITTRPRWMGRCGHAGARCRTRRTVALDGRGGRPAP